MVAVTVVVGWELDGLALPEGLAVGLPVAAVTVNVAVEALPSHVTDTMCEPAAAEVAIVAVPDRVPVPVAAPEDDWVRVTGAEKAVEVAWTLPVVVQPAAVIDRDCPAAMLVGLTVTVAAMAGVAVTRPTAAASAAVQTTREFIVDGSHRPVRSGPAAPVP
ncbi:hypothetical protein [Kitasatospora sp. NPDC051914]|uniref:hypothetical protein n=1 Tax=Kitasatospora sp. NPDC051914 TaxID=3154945 RepID=UPI0034272B97